MIKITDTLTLDESEIHMDFIHASGPGGQNVNKVATAVQLRFDVMNSPSLPDDVGGRLIKLAGSRMTKDGVLIIQAHRFRTQEKNRQDAIKRLVDLISKASVKPKIRRKKRPSFASKLQRLETKRKRNEVKRGRRVDPYKDT